MVFLKMLENFEFFDNGLVRKSHIKFFFDGTPIFYQRSRTVGVPLNLPVIDHINGVEL
jgi:hypothetical protein